MKFYAKSKGQGGIITLDYNTKKEYGIYRIVSYVPGGPVDWYQKVILEDKTISEITDVFLLSDGPDKLIGEIKEQSNKETIINQLINNSEKELNATLNRIFPDNI